MTVIGFSPPPTDAAEQPLQFLVPNLPPAGKKGGGRVSESETNIILPGTSSIGR